MSLLYVEDVQVSFDGFKALDIKYFSIEEKELRVVIGPNGAGKTTFLDVICGKTSPDCGKIIFGEGTELIGMTEVDIVKQGVGRKFQAPTVFSSLSVYENLLLAKKHRESLFTSMRSLMSQNEKKHIHAIVEKANLQDSLYQLAGSLSHGQKQWLEISMVILQEPQLLLVDEPAAGMSDEETYKTGEWLKELSKERSIIVIEHDMEFVRQIANTVTVLHQGKVLVEGPMEAVQVDPRVIECYLGSEAM